MCTHFYGFKYSYLIPNIYTQLDGLNLLFLLNNYNLFEHIYIISTILSNIGNFQKGSV